MPINPNLLANSEKSVESNEDEDIAHRLDRRIHDVEVQFFGFEIDPIRQNNRSFRSFLNYAKSRIKYYGAGIFPNK